MKDHPQIPEERHAGGLWCREVLDRLSDYLDHDLGPDEREQVEVHLRACDACARFGGEFAATVQSLRSHLLDPPVPRDVMDRVREALDQLEK